MSDRGDGQRGRGELDLWTAPGIDATEVAASLVAHTSELIALIDGDLRLAAVNQRLADATGYEPTDLLGPAALDLVAPDDIDRAALMLNLSEGGTTPAGTGGFGLLCADGSTVDTYVTACTIELDGQIHIAAVARPTFMPAAMDAILDGLLDGRPLAATLAPILEFFAWRENGSRISIRWTDPEDSTAHVITTGLDPSIAGELIESGDPWDRALRSGEPMEAHRDALDDAPRAAAERDDVERAWIVPVLDGDQVVALVTAWTATGGLDPKMHGYAMAAAKRHISLALRWTDQVRRLDDAAHTDALTGLANRRAFFEAIDRSTGGGAVLYCDLDGFKPVNDRWGHAVGDTLLVEVARRLAAEVRDRDVVARLGGDEFGIVLWGATVALAEQVADRIRVSCAAPVQLSAGEVTVGISVGVAHSLDQLDESTVEAADRLLYEDKRRR